MPDARLDAGGFASPGGSFASPGSVFAVADGSFAVPDGNFANPEAASTAADGAFAVPGGSSAGPDGSFAVAGSALAGPGASAAVVPSPMPPGPVFQRLAIIGAGLIGSSVARIAHARGRPGGDLAAEVVVSDSSPGVLTRVAALGFADRIEADPARAVQGADCVMLCAPVGAFAGIAAAIAPHLRPGAILTDVGSTKVSVIRDVAPLLPPGVRFIPGHPMAGTEYSGPDAGFTTLFQGRWCLLSPPPGADPAAVAQVSELWRRMGAMVECMDPAHHDRVVAVVSHLPHLIAFTICGTADGLAQDGNGDPSRSEVLKFAASGFRDFTRIAASDPVMWRDVFLNNREALLEVLARFMEDAQTMARAVRHGDGAYIEDRIHHGRRIRASLIELKQA